MNPHVVLVHFPIALLTIYSVLEVLHLKRLIALPYWFYIKAAFVILGALGAGASFLTGEIAEEQFRPSSGLHRLIETHANFALASLLFFGIIALLYAVAWLGRAGIFTRYHNTLNLVTKTEKFLASGTMPLLGIIGLALITVTGALGGSIAFGPDIDPVARFVYDFFKF
jgi:hypothetical protein